jgi:subtilisin-like proprotein convertase family protein
MHESNRYGRRTGLVTRVTTLGLVVAGAAVTLGATTAPALASSPSAPPNCTSQATTVSNTTAVAISASGTPLVSSTVVVSGAGRYLLDVDAITALQHSWAADLDVTLTSPAGTVVTLTTDNGSSNDNVFDGTRWDDDANPGGQVPYTTNDGMVTDTAYANLDPNPTLTPEEPLGAFLGEDPNGTWTLTIQDDENGAGGTLNSWSLDLTTLPTSPTTVAATAGANNTVVPIPTGPSIVASQVNISGAGKYLLDVDAITALQHTWSADLDMTLTSPAGTVVTLTTDNGAGNDNVFDGTRWDDDANPGGQVPYTSNDGMVTDTAYANLTPNSTLTPEEPLGAFIGEDPNGTWMLTIRDDQAGDDGALNSLELQLKTAACAPPDTQVTGVTVSAKKKQKMGNKLKVKSKVTSSDEAVKVAVTGKVTVKGNGPTKHYSLKKLTKSLAKGGKANLTQGLKGSKQKVANATHAIAQALSHGGKVSVKLSFTITDLAGNVLKTSKTVKIT